ncbi:MAG: hypothetical protein ABIQ47_06235 [Tepidiformaceae bacterium]
MGEKETAVASDAAARSGTLNVSASPGGAAALLADSWEPGGAGTPPSTETAIIKSKSNITNNRGEQE